MTEAAANIPHIDDDEKEIEQKMIKVISLMPEKVQARFKALKVLSDKRSRLSDEFDAEIKAIEQKINAKKQPLYLTRQKIVEGELTEFAQYKNQFAEHYAGLETYHAENVTKKKSEGEP